MPSKSSSRIPKTVVAGTPEIHYRKTLLDWFGKNRRPLPWRETKDPYRIWISEIMLQQTRVEQAVGYYLRFCRQFPTLGSLAAAQEAAVLRAWQGLGYYSRARNLHQAARTLVAEAGGKMPASFSQLLELKGVGNYTAAAIASISYDEPVAAVDGNVERVISRIFGMDEPVNSASGRKRIRQIANKLLDKNMPGDFNQAMMEFGALHCTPKKPGCEACAFRQQCFAYKKNMVASLPAKTGMVEIKKLWMYFFVFRFGKRIYMRHRHDAGIWKNLYDFPSVNSLKKQKPGVVMKTFFSSHDSLPGYTLEKSGDEIIHQLSHRKIHAKFFEFSLNARWMERPSNIRELKIADLGDVAVPRLVENYLFGKSAGRTIRISGSGI